MMKKSTLMEELRQLRLEALSLYADIAREVGYFEERVEKLEKAALGKKTPGRRRKKSSPRRSAFKQA
jgi:hypothetical protein